MRPFAPFHPFRGPAVAGGGAFTYYSTEFDGSTYLYRGGDVMPDGDKGLLSVWLKMTAASSDTGTYALFGNLSAVFYLVRDNDGSIRMTVYDTGSAWSFQIRSNANSLIKSSGWVHILLSWDMSTSGRRNLFINGVEQSNVDRFSVGATLEYATGNFAIGSYYGGSLTMICLVSELYITDEWLDLSSSGNRDKFFNSGTSKPVDLGADGSTPTGTQPRLYLHNDYSAFGTNSGSGGNFNVQSGTLIDGGADIP